jgi:phosphate:Na+ symporter
MPLLFASADPDFLQILVGVFGGLALFLFGMGQMTDTLKSVAGRGMRTLLARLTTNRFTGAFTGAFVTAVVQSSSVTTVLLVGFISAGLMSLEQAIGVIMGANIGSTITAQLIAFNVSQFALPLITIGFALSFLAKKDQLRLVGAMVMGLGLIFYGMSLMSQATHPLRAYEPFIGIMRSMDNVLLAIAVAALFTAVIQSSAATTGIVIVLASQGYITLEAGIALALGANIGTCITALLAAIGRPAAAKQAALAHVLFNIAGVIIWAPFISPFADLVQSISPAAPHLDGIARRAAEAPRQIANAHTAFNVLNTFLFIGFTVPLARLVRWFVPERSDEERKAVKPKYLDAVCLATPALALDRVRMELGHLGERVIRMTEAAAEAVVQGTRQDLQHVTEMDDDVDILYTAILEYIRRLGTQRLSNNESLQLQNLVAVTGYLDSAAELIATNLVPLGAKRIEQDLIFSSATLEILRPLNDGVARAMRDALRAVAENDRPLAEQVIESKFGLYRQADLATEHLSKRLLADEPHRVVVFSAESDIVEHMRRVYYYARRIAKLVAGSEAASEPTASLEEGK